MYGDTVRNVETYFSGPDERETRILYCVRTVADAAKTNADVIVCVGTYVCEVSLFFTFIPIFVSLILFIHGRTTIFIFVRQNQCPEKYTIKRCRATFT